MDGFLLAFLMVAALASGGRDQVMLGQWSDALGRSMPLLLVAVLSAALTAAAMAWVGAGFAVHLPARGAQMLVAFAFGMAGIELALPVRMTPPKEPTRSLPALLIVLLARQIGDGARFGIVALAAWTDAPFAAGLGGAIGGAATVALGWSAGAQTLARWPLRAFRLTLAVALIVAALLLGIDARFGDG